MVEYDPNSDGDAETDLVMLKPTKYVIGAEIEGDPEWHSHTHIFYLRDNLPLATTDNEDNGEHHAHSIAWGPEGTVICVEAAGHTHTVMVVEEAGDYAIRTLFTG